MNTNNLRVIRTARTEQAINDAAEQGFWPLVKTVIPNPDIRRKYAVLQNKTTGAIEVINDYRAMKENDEVVIAIGFTSYYPHSFPSPYAAYLIPKDITIGEQVWIEDLIEDFVGSSWNQGDTYRLPACEAVWDGTDLIVHYKDATNNTIVG